MSVYIIAEAGVNHNGSLKLAKELVRVASECGADAVKFQTFKTDALVTKAAEKAQYQIENDSNSNFQSDMLRKLELTANDFSLLKKECDKYNIDFMTACFDSESIHNICDLIKPECLKIGSGELTNLPFLIEHARTGADLIVSTGMSTLSEVEDALAALAFGYFCTVQSEPLSYSWLKENYFTHEMIRKLKGKVTLLHCVTDYPANVEDLNLRAIEQLKYAYNLNVGYSDHSLGIHACCAAVALGAVCIEKHLTLDTSMEGPDHAASASPGEFKQLVTAIRALDISLKSRIKVPTPRELVNKNVARKYLVARSAISKGDILSKENIAIMRSSKGCDPKEYWDFIGRRSENNYLPGDVLKQ